MDTPKWFIFSISAVLFFSFTAPAKAEAKKPKADGGRVSPAPAAKPRKLSYREQQEFEQMETAILAAEETVVARQAEVEQAAANHVALADACRALEEAQHTVERLYTRWQELEAKRGS